MSASCTPEKLLSSCPFKASPQSDRSLAVLLNLCPVLVCSWSSNCCPITFAEVWLTTGLPCEAGCSPCESMRTFATPLAFSCAASAVGVLPSLSLGLGISQQFLRPSRRPDRHPTSLLESVLTLGGSCTRHDVSAASTKQASLQSRWVLAGSRGSFSRRFETGEPPVSKPHGAPKSSSCPHVKGSSTEVDIPWPILLSALVPR